MAYDDDAYLRASEQLRNAVYALLENEISLADIHREVDSAAEDAE